MQYKENLINKFKSKDAVIGIFGLGYVGLPLSLNYVRAGYKVIGFDIDLHKINTLSKGKSTFKLVDSSFYDYIKSKKFIPTINFKEASLVDALIICVPTPLNKHNQPNLDYIYNAITLVSPHLKKGQVMSLESTTYPGTTEEELKPRIESKGFEVGEDFFIVYSPEREDPGNKAFKTKEIPKIVSGITKSCLEVGIELYKETISSLVPVSDTKTAEMTKLLENIHRSVNIGLMNELKPLTQKMGIDIYEVIKAAATKPFGFVPYYPGPGLGGHCIPIDPFYLSWKAKEYNCNIKFIELAAEINTSMPSYVVDQVVNILNTKKMPINGSRILILGLAYKKNIDDIRESPALEIISLLQNKGASITFNDPYIEKLENQNLKKLIKIELTESAISSQDAIILVTDHDLFNYDLISKMGKLIIDTRGRFKKAKNIFSA